MTDKTDKARTKWATLAKRITERVMERQEKMQDLCPGNPLATEDRQQTLKAICGMNREIARLTEEMAGIEEESHVGSTPLLGQEPGALVRTVMALMAVARFSPEVGRDARSVDDIVGLVGARDPEDSLSVRALFRDDSVLRPHVNISYGPTLDESGVRLKEPSLNRLLSQQPSDKSEMMAEAVAMIGKWK